MGEWTCDSCGIAFFEDELTDQGFCPYCGGEVTLVDDEDQPTES